MQFLFAAKQGQARLDSLKSELSKNLSDISRLKLLNNLSYDYYLVNPEMGIKYAEQQLQLAKKLKEKRQIGSAYNNLAINYSAMSDYARALKYFFKSLEIAKELKDMSGISANLGNIAVIYDYQGDSKKALEYYGNALQISYKLKNKRGIALNLSNIGIVYTNSNDYPKALVNLKEALKIFESLKDSSGISRCFGNIGKVYSGQNNFQPALEYFSKALKISENLGDTRGIGVYLGNIGETYFSIANHEKNSQKRTSIVNFKTKNNLLLAMRYFSGAIEKFKEINELYYLQTYFNLMSETFEMMGDNKNAIKYYKEHVRIKDSVFSMETKKEISELIIKHDLDLKIAENKRRLEEKARIAKEHDNYTTTVQYTAISIFVILLLLGTTIFGKVISSVSLVDKLVFLVFLLIFEFITIIVEKPVNSITSSEPIFLLVTNTILALAITPLHSLLEHRIKSKITKKREKE